MQSEIGALDERAVRSTFERVWNGPMTTCQKAGGVMISGNIVVRVRINHAGNAKWAYLKGTNLADRSVETCILDAVRSATWPTPQGGEDGIAEQELSFADYSTRAPVEWPEQKARDTVANAESSLSNCRNGASGTFLATAIINNDGSVASVGMQQPDETTDEATECMVNVIRKLTFPKTGSWPAKVSFSIR